MRHRERGTRPERSEIRPGRDGRRESESRQRERPRGEAAALPARFARRAPRVGVRPDANGVEREDREEKEREVLPLGAVPRVALPGEEVDE